MVLQALLQTLLPSPFPCQTWHCVLSASTLTDLIISSLAFLSPLPHPPQPTWLGILQMLSSNFSLAHNGGASAPSFMSCYI